MGERSGQSGRVGQPLTKLTTAKWKTKRPAIKLLSTERGGIL